MLMCSLVFELVMPTQDENITLADSSGRAKRRILIEPQITGDISETSE